ncbi:hypothetical protein QQZ08_002118 [Neonectria magnoliae]|uniref:Uncharacterized protein n=1 Tax=Neonectria magnoliae TaxID=2732573 RepID=A0ABR1IEF6_9HYPO
MARVWFVTGSSRGLGLAVVEAILASGDSVVASARKTDSISHLVAKYSSDRILTVPLNSSLRWTPLSKHLVVSTLWSTTQDTRTFASIEDISLESFRAQIETLFFGVVRLSCDAQAGSGHIIQVSSIGGRVATPGLAAYQSAKWAIGGFSTSLSQEVAPFGIKVTVLEPGGMHTELGSSLMQPIPVSEGYEQTVREFFKAVDIR